MLQNINIPGRSPTAVREELPYEMRFDRNAGKYYPARIYKWKEYYKPWTNEGNAAIDSFIEAGLIDPALSRDRKSFDLSRAFTNIDLYPSSGWKFVETGRSKSGVIRYGKFVRDVESGQTFPKNYEIENKLAGQFRSLYDALVKEAPKAKYGGKGSDLEELFRSQAKQLGKKGITDLSQLTKVEEGGKSFLANKETGEKLFSLTRDKDTKATKWGESNVTPGLAQFAVEFDELGRPVFFPVFEKSKNIVEQVFGEDIAKVAGPILAVASVVYGVPTNIASGALLGAGISEALGGDPIKGAISGAIGSIGSTTYATQVGNALGVTGTAAPIVGNAFINSGLSGIAAVATGGNVEKSMFQGAVSGAAFAGATEFAEAILGKENIASIASTLGLSEAQVANVFTTSAANGLVAENNGTGDFLETMGTSLVAQGVGAKSANLMTEATAKVLKDNPEIRASVITAAGGIATVATDAVLQRQDVGKALENAAPGIILSSVQAGQREADRQEELAAQREKEVVAAQQPVQVAGPVAPVLTEIDTALQAAELRGESVVGRSTEDGETTFQMVGTRDDGSTYSYKIHYLPSVGVKYEYSQLPTDPITLRVVPGQMGTQVTSQPPDFRGDATIGVPSTQDLVKLDTAQDFEYLPSQLRLDLTQTIVRNELDRLERELQQLQESQQAFQRAQTQFTGIQERGLGQELRPEVRESLEEELAGLEEEAQRAGERAGQIESERATLTGIESGEQGLSDEQLLSFLETGEVPAGITGGQREGEGEAPEGGLEAGEGEEGGAGRGEGGEGEGAGGEGEGEGGAGVTETRLRPSVVFDRATGGRPETTPFASRVTGEALASILGEKQPLFGGDEDEQQAVWNRRSLRLLSRALGL